MSNETLVTQIIDYFRGKGVLREDPKHIYKIRVHRDFEVSMAWVTVDDQCIYAGNFWDFHNGCHGCKIPTFTGIGSYVEVLKRCLKAANRLFEVQEVQASWYDDEDEDEQYF